MRGKRGLNHVHVGSLHAPDDEMAVHAARDLYTRRNEGVSIWVVRAATSPRRAPTRRTRCSPPAATRSTATRRSTRSPRTCRTCERAASARRSASRRRPSPRREAVAQRRRSTRRSTDAHERRGAVGVRHRVRRAAGRSRHAPSPDGVDPADLAQYCLMLGDDALVLAQRLTEWVTAAPELEEEVALANIALDLLGQARLLLARAGSVGVSAGGRAVDEDALAYLRRRRVPQHRRSSSCADDGDFAHTMVRLLVASTVRLAVFTRLRDVPRPGARRDRRQGRQRAGLPPRPRRPLDAAPRRRHRRVAPARAGRARRVWPLLPTSSSAPTDVERRLAAAGVAVDPAAVARRGRRRARPRCSAAPR